MDYVTTFERGPIHGPGQLDGLRRMRLGEAFEVARMDPMRVGRVIHAPTLAEVTPGYTADRQPVTQNLRVWDYDRERGYVDLSEAFEDGGPGGPVWFKVVREIGDRRGKLMDGQRVCTVDPVTGERA